MKEFTIDIQKRSENFYVGYVNLDGGPLSGQGTTINEVEEEIKMTMVNIFHYSPDEIKFNYNPE
jgi:hypothetical protein